MLETMLDYIRVALYIALIVIGFFLFQAWDKEHPKLDLPLPTQAEPLATTGHFTPEVSRQATPVSIPSPVDATHNTVPASAVTKGELVTVKTDVLEVSIDTRGGDIVETKLLKYPESLNAKTPFVLFNDNDKTRYIAESGLLSTEGPDTTQAQALYTATQKNYSLNPNQNEIAVPLTWQNKDGVRVTKMFHFAKGSYEIKVDYAIANQSTQPWQGQLYTQLMRTNVPPPSNSGMISLATYFGAALSTPQKPFTKISFKEMHEKSFNQTVEGGWAAMIQHYFISAWVPPAKIVSHYYAKALQNGLYLIGMISDPMHVTPGQSLSLETKLYAGPAIADQLERTAPGLKLTIDYGWFWFISGVIFWMMQKIYEVVGNWGWSIVLVTIIIKLFFYHLSAKSYRSMSMLKKLQPRVEALKERYGDDKQKMTQATLELYRQEKVNPMSGCLPILIQIPVFIALYWVLVESVQMRQAPFILWIHDLSQHDPYYVLPILMGISMFIQQRLNPPPADPMQAKVMMLMPIIFTVLFANFPAGLMLYWFVNNTLSFLQQWYIMNKLDKGTNNRKTS